MDLVQRQALRIEQLEEQLSRFGGYRARGNPDGSPIVPPPGGSSAIPAPSKDAKSVLTASESR